MLMYTYTHQATMSWTLALKKLTESTVPDLSITEPEWIDPVRSEDQGFSSRIGYEEDGITRQLMKYSYITYIVTL